ncbi:MAG: hypothetical protein KKF62_16845 [Bacteroidetes bacterium]|nr:hypothetical protein [Bacteroidota bacterium]MBU1116169.1 hypothetical protein [Bacteroidota bacterium]MBU1800461.1 hypothetical protein [Bacteroidota bacterium]
MKNLMNVALVLFTLALLTSTMFGQVRKLDGTGNPDAAKINWVDANGDGICDNFGTDLQGVGSQSRMNKGVNKGTGVCDGTGSGLGDGSGVRPQDGTGFGKKNGGGVCVDGTSALQKGSGRRGNK